MYNIEVVSGALVSHCLTKAQGGERESNARYAWKASKVPGRVLQYSPDNNNFLGVKYSY